MVATGKPKSIWPNLVSLARCLFFLGGDRRDRTADLLIANQTLSQLSYAPETARILLAATRSVNPAVACGIARAVAPRVAARSYFFILAAAAGTTDTAMAWA